MRNIDTPTELIQAIQIHLDQLDAGQRADPAAKLLEASAQEVSRLSHICEAVHFQLLQGKNGLEQLRLLREGWQGQFCKEATS